jgi:hypothetical protein
MGPAMADDKKEKEQRKFIESQGLKILELLVTLAPVSKGVKEVWKIGKETNKALSMLEGSCESGSLSASDGNINRLKTISSQLSNELSRLNRFDENWWIQTSGANLFSAGDSTRALGIFQLQRTHLLALRDACEGLKTLAAVAFANTVSDVKGLAKLYIPSVPIVDAEVTKENPARI